MLRLRIHRMFLAESKLWVLAFLVLVAGCLGFVVHDVLRSQGSGTKWLGGFFLMIGSMNLLLYRKGGRKLFSRTQSFPPFFSKFWTYIGENGVQFLFLGLGVIF